MQAERERVIAVIKDFTDGLQTREAIARRADTEAIGQALVASCKKLGVPLQAYRDTIASDETLATLEKQAMTQALSGPVDPGPHDAISRESPSGQPGNLDKNRTPS